MRGLAGKVAIIPGGATKIGAAIVAAFQAEKCKVMVADINAEAGAALTGDRLAWMQERTEGKHARGTNIIPFSMHQIDELLNDLRLPIGGMQRFMEWQMPVKPGAYKKVAARLKKRLGLA